VTVSLEHQLTALAEQRYHHRHPFNLRMHEGLLSPDELRRWVLNRFHYQRHIPIKDALILTKLENPQQRRSWLRRIQEQDGTDDDPGGLDRWLRLGEAVGLDRDELQSGEGVLPAVRFAVGGYVSFVRDASRLSAVASSLTELFAPDLMVTRIAAWEQRYPWIEPAGLRYFQTRVVQGRRDAREAIDLVHRWVDGEADREAVRAAFRLKCDVLWSLLDAVENAHADQVELDHVG
jgi:pyrroloquinoline-quinone synthase